MEPRNKRALHAAQALWRETLETSGSAVSDYLYARGIYVPLPEAIRFHPRLRHAPSGRAFPSMIAEVKYDDDRFCAVHRTYLSPDRAAKAAITPNKMALGSMEDGAVRLAPAAAVLGLAEGIETALSAMQLFRLPCWAALGSRLHRVRLPKLVDHVILFADRGDAGKAAALRALQVFRRQGLVVTVRPPDPPFED